MMLNRWKIIPPSNMLKGRIKGHKMEWNQRDTNCYPKPALVRKEKQENKNGGTREQYAYDGHLSLMLWL